MRRRSTLYLGAVLLCASLSLATVLPTSTFFLETRGLEYSYNATGPSAGGFANSAPQDQSAELKEMLNYRLDLSNALYEVSTS